MKGYRFCLHKAYFETGMGLTSYLKYVAVLIGGGSLLLTEGNSTLSVAIGAVLFGIFCYFIGRWWYKSQMKVAEIEVNNQFNLFVKQMRKKKHL